MDGCSQVESLFPLATKAILQGMVSKLKVSIQAEALKGKPPAKKKRKVDSIATSNSSSVVEDIRAELNEYLISWYNKVRPEIVNQFIATFCYNGLQPAFDEQLYFAFFDSILDHTFTSWTPTGSLTEIVTKSGNVTTLSPFLLTDPIRLVQIITSRSPLIKNLDFSFQLHQQAEPVGRTFTQLLGSLQNLTSLTLSCTSWLSIDFYSNLGHYCPQLAALQLARVNLSIEKLLALMLGDKQALLPPDFHKDYKTKFINVQFTPESLHPICSSLKELRLEEIAYYHYYDQGSDSFIPPASFILRHFRQLEKLNGSADYGHGPTNLDCTVKTAVLHLHKQQLARRSSRQQQINTNRRSSKELGVIEWTVKSPFIGIYYLLKYIQINLKTKTSYFLRNNFILVS